jgi:hypothetical protein
MRVYGIDPAPTKGLAIFDGREDCCIPLEKSRAFIDGLKNASDDLLICWDAPLTGPPSSVTRGAPAFGSAFSQRTIESFFSRQETGFKTPPGISVRGYSGCPHWALSRSLIGLPITGPFDDAACLPFRLVSQNGDRPNGGRSVVEVHPALALWLWCRDVRGASASWDYKHDAAVRNELWAQFCGLPVISKTPATLRSKAPSSDDQLDARLAYALGWLWLNEPGSVVLLGDLDLGTFLLPKVPTLEEGFYSFTQGLPNKPLQPTGFAGG